MNGGIVSRMLRYLERDRVGRLTDERTIVRPSPAAPSRHRYVSSRITAEEVRRARAAMRVI